MSDLTTTQHWLLANKFDEISHYSPVGGGCINNTGRLSLRSGKTLFVKQHDNPPDGFFAAEAEGLHALRQAGTLRVPQVVHVDAHYLLLEDLGNGSPNPAYWTELGQQLAALHLVESASFGFSSDNFCGITPQINPMINDGVEFFGQYRLAALVAIADKKGLLQTSDMNALESLIARLGSLIPDQPPVLIHGDLWSGNIHCDKEGQPALIDPACYWGWAEAEMSMTILFGEFDPRFYSAYEESSNIDKDWRERAELYNLYHLLNHLILFGASYLGQVRAVLNRY